MEQLPTDIEQKLENLPTIAFDANEDFQAVIFSQDFTDIFNYYKEKYLPDVLKTKPELYQRISLYMNLTNQDSSFLEQTDQVLYRRHCPTIEEFLTNNYYHGRLAGTMYPYWKEQLYDIFKVGSPVRKTIFSGAIGTGKSTIARKAVVYVLYRLLCLRYPRAVFNVDADSTLANFILSVTLKQVYDTNLLPFIKLLEGMPCFQRVMSVKAFDNFDLNQDNCPVPFVVEKSTDTVFFPDNIILTAGSQISHTVGYNIVNSFCFTGNMKVYTNYGIITFKSLLRQFKEGIRPSTYCINKDGIKEKVKIIDVKETRKVTELLRIYYDNERYIECTPDHPFVINNPKQDDPNIIYENRVAYKQAQYLTEDDDIASEDQAYVYALMDNRPSSKGYNKPFYIGISAHENTMTDTLTSKYLRPYSHFTEKSLSHEINPIKKSIIESILEQKLLPEVKILNTGLLLEKACEIEKSLIKQYGKVIDKTGNLANISDGGEGVLLITPEIIDRKSKKIHQTKLKQKEEKIKNQITWLSNVINLYIVWNILEGKRLIANYNKKLAASRPEKVSISSKHMITYNKSDKHRKRTAELNHLYPKVFSVESRKKLAKSQSLTWNRKTVDQKKIDNLSKSIGRAWNVLKRIEGSSINEQIFNSHRSKGSRLANTEPLWKTIIEKSGSINTFLDLIEQKFGKRFIYEN